MSLALRRRRKRRSQLTWPRSLARNLIFAGQKKRSEPAANLRETVSSHMNAEPALTLQGTCHTWESKTKRTLYHAPAAQTAWEGTRHARLFQHVLRHILVASAKNSTKGYSTQQPACPWATWMHSAQFVVYIASEKLAKPVAVRLGHRETHSPHRAWQLCSNCPTVHVTENRSSEAKRHTEPAKPIQQNHHFKHISTSNDKPWKQTKAPQKRKWTWEKRGSAIPPAETPWIAAWFAKCDPWPWKDCNTSCATMCGPSNPHSPVYVAWVARKILEGPKRLSTGKKKTNKRPQKKQHDGEAMHEVRGHEHVRALCSTQCVNANRPDCRTQPPILHLQHEQTSILARGTEGKHPFNGNTDKTSEMQAKNINQSFATGSRCRERILASRITFACTSRKT